MDCTIDIGGFMAHFTDIKELFHYDSKMIDR